MGQCGDDAERGERIGEVLKRVLRLVHTHTQERVEIAYAVGDRYVDPALEVLNRFLRDWRRNEPARMDPRLLDLVWEVYQRSGAKDYIHIVSAALTYRWDDPAVARPSSRSVVPVTSSDISATLA